MKTHTKYSENTPKCMQHCSLSENKENRNQNIPPQNQKQGQKNNMYAALTSSRDIHLPTHNRYERASLLEGVLNKKLKVHIGNTNIDRILQANSEKNKSKVDLMIITELSKHAHTSSTECIAHRLSH
jgi:hypothetical protein